MSLAVFTSKPSLDSERLIEWDPNYQVASKLPNGEWYGMLIESFVCRSLFQFV
jgi:hypothetical protein